jgi:PEP-CTERM motif-containing protein
MSAPPFRMCVVSALFLLGAARSSTADPVVIYSNFGPSPGYLSEGWPNSGWLSSEENGYYMGFQLTEAARLTSVTLPVAWAGELPVEFGAWVYSSSGGARGELIERMVVPFPADVPPRTITTLTLSSSLQPMLSANTLYFLTASPTRITGQFGFAFGLLWPWNNAGVSGPVIAASPVGMSVGTGQLGAFQLTGEPSPVPEPATILLFATGAGFVLQRVRRRRWA